MLSLEATISPLGRSALVARFVCFERGHMLCSWGFNQAMSQTRFWFIDDPES